MPLTTINKLSPSIQKEQLLKCCGSSKWATKMLEYFPINKEDTLWKTAEEIWYQQCQEADWREAFTHHPKIGDIESLAKKFATTKAWAGNEQAGVNSASMETLEALAAGNEAYEEKFGYIFIICATGKTAKEMLEALEARLPNDTATELKIAMGEQHKITLIRLKKWMEE